MIQDNENIENHIYLDALTGLPNKVLFRDRLTQALSFAKRKKQTVAVLFLRVDDIKTINDTIGQECGDQLLKEITGRLQECLRKSDTIARPGRDEFMIMLPEITRAEDASLVVQKIFEFFDSHFLCGKHEFFLTVNIGISIYPGDGDNSITLIKNAYTAMRNARILGKNTSKFYSKAMNERAFERMIMTNNLRHALRRNEFVLHYQPQADCKNSVICGMEALVRWQRARGSLVYPNSFIDLMEETGLIVPLGEWVLRSACSQFKVWQKDGLEPMRMAVNISARQFHQEDIVEMIIRALEETSLDPECLELELTENVFMRDMDTVTDVLKVLRKMGVRISLDDFGTGYSSLYYLKKFSIDRLKMVKAFVSSVSMESDDRIIAKAIVEIAHCLNMKVVAEGIEDDAHLVFICSIDCDEYQGHLFCHPLPAKELIKILTKNKLL